MTDLESRFSGIEAFVGTARAGSFTAAARALGMTPSGVAKSVGRLEKRIGLKLLHRSTRRLTLTPEGEAYLATCAQIIDTLDGAEHGLAPRDRAPQGRLRMELPGAFGRRHVLPTLLEMAGQFPALDLSLSFSERTIDLVEQGFDLAIRIGRLPDDGQLVARRLGVQRLVICAAPDYLQQRGRPESITDLRRHDCISGPRQHQDHWILRTPQDQTTQFEISQFEIQARHRFSDGEAMLAAGIAGCGIMQMPTWLVGADIAAGRLQTVLDDYAGADMPIHAIWPKTRFIQPRVRTVVDRLVELAGQADAGFMP